MFTVDMLELWNAGMESKGLHIHMKKAKSLAPRHWHLRLQGHGHIVLCCVTVAATLWRQGLALWWQTNDSNGCWRHQDQRGNQFLLPGCYAGKGCGSAIAIWNSCPSPPGIFRLIANTWQIQTYYYERKKELFCFFIISEIYKISIAETRFSVEHTDVKSGFDT